MTKNTKDLQRQAEILRLRFEEKMTLVEIGEVFNISKERVRQIIGFNSGFVAHKYRKTLRNKDWLRETQSLTNQQVSEMVGVQRHSVSRYRSGIRHAADGAHAVPQEWQSKIGKMLEDMGVENELRPYMKIPHIVTKSGLGIVVRAANPGAPTHPGIKSDQYRFITERRKDTDFFVFVLLDRQEFFVVPEDRVPETQKIVFFCYPSLKPRNNEDAWQNYKDRWDLIVDTEKERLGA